MCDQCWKQSPSPSLYQAINQLKTASFKANDCIRCQYQYQFKYIKQPFYVNQRRPSCIACFCTPQLTLSCIASCSDAVILVQEYFSRHICEGIIVFSDVWHFLGQYIKVFFSLFFSLFQTGLVFDQFCSFAYVWHTVTNDVQLATIQFFF